MRIQNNELHIWVLHITAFNFPWQECILNPGKPQGFRGPSFDNLGGGFRYGLGFMFMKRCIKIMLIIGTLQISIYREPKKILDMKKDWDKKKKRD